MNKDTLKLYTNRVVSFLAGGLLVFAVMSFTVVDSAKKQNAELTKALDVSRYEAGRLFADAKEQFAQREYAEAKSSLTTLFDNQPGSAETAEGKKLLASIETAEKASDTRWLSDSAIIRLQWTKARAGELRAESDKARTQLEKDMSSAMDQEWEKAKDKIREDWLKQVQL